MVLPIGFEIMAGPFAHIVMFVFGGAFQRILFYAAL
jgi:hypothetical protein